MNPYQVGIHIVRNIGYTDGRADGNCGVWQEYIPKSATYNLQQMTNLATSSQFKKK